MMTNWEASAFVWQRSKESDDTTNQPIVAVNRLESEGRDDSEFVT
jgi:hypothetical protein